jgi:hypothetical protein
VTINSASWQGGWPILRVPILKLIFVCSEKTAGAPPFARLSSPETSFTQCPYTSFTLSVFSNDSGSQRSMMFERWLSESSSRTRVLQ